MCRFTILIHLAVGFFLLLASVLLPGLAAAAVLTTDTVWQGEVRLDEDVLVPAGVILTVAPGTRITVSAAESTKTDPEFLSPLAEITVRGILRVNGTQEQPVSFAGSGSKAGGWAGIIVDGGTAQLAWCRIGGADTAVLLLVGNLELSESILQGNKYGLVASGPAARATLSASRVTENDYGLVILHGALVTRRGSTVTENRKRDTFTPPTKPRAAEPLRTSPPVKPRAREYGDVVLAGETVWQGLIRVDGTVRVPEGGRLVVLPGTIVEFTRRDTNGDGIGENGLLVQGRLLVKGTLAAPIVFRSAAPRPGMGDWDAINLMNSDGAQNLLEHCRIEDAYRGLHFHFSHVLLNRVELSHCYRGVQFQESAVEIRNCCLEGNKSGVQGRDSTVLFTGNRVADNYDGANFLRVHLTARDNRFTGNRKEGLRLRESLATLSGNLIDGNRFGLQVADAVHGSISGNVISANAETGLALRNVDNLEVSGNFLVANGLNGMSVQEAQATVHGNLLAGNGERGLGILSFAGRLAGNAFAANGLFALDFEGKADLAAPDNWWGGEPPERVIADRRLDPSRGQVRTEQPRPEPPAIAWPLAAIPADAAWYGAVAVERSLAVPPGVGLTLAPGTRVLFSRGAGLAVRGRLDAVGRREAPIFFTAREPAGPGSWDEVLLEYAAGSRIRHCIFEFASWGLHSHFTNLTVADSLFRANEGGLRFRSGPLEVLRSTFTGNAIGIRAYRGNAIIRENLITANEVGIFVREKGGGLTITANNLAGNREYAVRVGDFNDEDVSAPDNWWGPGDPSGYLFDGRNEPGIGMVLFAPYRRAPLSLAGGGSP